MDIRDPRLHQLYAYCGAGQATAEWLTGIDPTAVYRIDSFCPLLAELHTPFEIVLIPEDAGQAYLKRARARVLNQAFVSMAGSVAAQLCYKPDAELQIHRSRNRDHDIQRTIGYLRALTQKPDEINRLLSEIEQASANLLSQPRIVDCMSRIANSVAEHGDLTNARRLRRFFVGLGVYRSSFPNTPLKWAVCRDNIFSVMVREENLSNYREEVFCGSPATGKAENWHRSVGNEGTHG